MVNNFNKYSLLNAIDVLHSKYYNISAVCNWH